MVLFPGSTSDNDCEPDDTTILDELSVLGVTIFRWEQSHATEDHLFRDLPTEAVVALIKAAAAFQESEQSFLGHLSNKYSKERFRSVSEVMRAAGDVELRVALGEVTKSRPKGKSDGRERGWFKDISLAEWIGRRHVGPHLDQLKGKFPETIAEIRAWVDREQ